VNLTVQAQTSKQVSKEEQQDMLEKITAASQKMQSLLCDFEQTKELSILNEQMISKGKLYYRNDNCLRWEYLSPYSYVFVLNKQKILMQAENSRSVTDVKSSRFFQEIVKIMMNGISGSGLNDRQRFDARYYKAETAWEVQLIPLQKEIKQMFATITLRFNPRDYTVEQVVMSERNGDLTIIRLSGKQINGQIEDHLFHID
jgi:outer membrane lipoprotein-sorting protein